MAGSEEVDVVVLGVGTEGENLSLRLAGAGLEVVGVTDELVGGECAYWACIPSKMMTRAGNLIQEARRVNGLAGRAEVTPDWSQVADRVRNEAAGGWDDAPAAERFTARGGRLVRGRGRLTGPHTVTVDDQSFTARRAIVIATGSKPAVPPIPGLADVDYWVTHEAIAAEALPDSLLVLGGGATGCELGQVFARFGVDVTIVEGADRLMPHEEPEASAVLEEALEDEGLTVVTGTLVQGVEAVGRDGGAVRATLDTGTELRADRLLVAAGRKIEVEGLGLDAAGIDASGGFVPVDDHLRAADGIWALGDVTGKALFTHVAAYQGSIVEADILGLDPPAADYVPLPRVAFTDPEVAAVGLSEADARAEGVDVITTVKPVPNTFRGWLHGPGAVGLIKLVADRGAGVLVGGTAVGPNGGEVLGLLTVAVRSRVPLAELRHTIYAFPTHHGGVGEALGAFARGLQDVLDPEGDRSLFPSMS